MGTQYPYITPYNPYNPLLRMKHRDMEREWKQRLEELRSGLATARDTIQAQKIQMTKLIPGFTINDYNSMIDEYGISMNMR